ncbi:hypothetical protein ABKN59_005686 [Abortiporus biennis]
MAQPTQALPSWLTLSSTTFTFPDGSESTFFMTHTLPLTYYGPSIPLGTDGIWTYGGLTSPPPSTALPSSTATSLPPTTTTPPTITSAPSSTSSSTSPAFPTTTTVSPVGATSSGGISVAVFAGVIAALVAVIFFLLIVFTLLYLRSRREAPPPGQETGESSSFYNRQTTLFSRISGFVTGGPPPPTPTSVPGQPRRSRLSRLFFRGSRSTPIWTGLGFSRGEDGQHTPGEGSPRGSGEEVDPFLTRRSVHSQEMAQTKSGSDTLVSVPAAAILSNTGTTRTSPPKTGHIIPRERLLQMAQEDSFAGSTSGSMSTATAAPPYADIRIVEPSPHPEQSPLLPPPPLDPDGLHALGVRNSRGSDQSGSSSQARSLGSQKSNGSIDIDAEILNARRVRVDELGLGQPSNRRRQRQGSVDPSLADPNSGDSYVPGNTLGLNGLSGRIGRFSWFKRLSGIPASPVASTSQQDPGPSSAQTIPENDPYTRTPPRTPRRNRRSRNESESWEILPTGDDSAERDVPSSPSPAGSSNNANRRSLGFLTAGSRPMSSVSTGTTSVYHDAVETPVSDVDSVPPLPGLLAARSGSSGSGNGSGGSGSGRNSSSGNGQSPSQGGRSTSRLGLSETGLRSQSHSPNPVPSGHPPAYDDSSIPRLRSHSRLPSDIDVLDMPAPAPTYNSSRPPVLPMLPPGLAQLPTPLSWRESYVDSNPSNTSHRQSGSSAGIHIDVLEDEPPVAGEGWRNLSSSGGGGGSMPMPTETRRTTFGSQPVVVHQHNLTNSEEGSLHSMRSHLSPYASHSAIGSAPASARHTLTGSNSSRPSAHSHARSGSSGFSLGHASSVSSRDVDRRRQLLGTVDEDELVPVRSPPLSAVYPRPSWPVASPPGSRPSSPSSPLERPPRILHSFLSSTDGSPTPSRIPLLMGQGEGTITSSRTNDSAGHSSVTTALTDPITGTRMHFPGMPSPYSGQQSPPGLGPEEHERLWMGSDDHEYTNDGW